MEAVFDLSKHRPNLGSIPWIDGKPKEYHESLRVIRWALEVDNSTESNKVLSDKFATYRDKHASGEYAATFFGDIVPVFIFQFRSRAVTMSEIFREVWPNGWAIVSIPGAHGTDSSPYGSLWGTYRSMAMWGRGGEGAEIDLLSRPVRDHRNRVVGIESIMSFDEWEFCAKLMKEQRVPESFGEMIEMMNGRASCNARSF